MSPEQLKAMKDAANQGIASFAPYDWDTGEEFKHLPTKLLEQIYRAQCEAAHLKTLLEAYVPS